MRGRYLNETDRIHIADRVREKASIREIARELGRGAGPLSEMTWTTKTQGGRARCAPALPDRQGVTRYDCGSAIFQTLRPNVAA
jgi:hypothetical protein